MCLFAYYYPTHMCYHDHIIVYFKNIIHNDHFYTNKLYIIMLNFLPFPHLGNINEKLVKL